MIFTTRSITIAATAWQNGIRIYSQSGDGNLLEGYMNQDVEKIMTAEQEAELKASGKYARLKGTPEGKKLSEQVVGWRLGKAYAACLPGSNLCCISWGNNSNLSVIYQTHDGVLREMRHFEQPNWYVTDFSEPDARRGTGLAEVHSLDAKYIVVFFQDNENYLCYRKARHFSWEAKVRITKLAPASAIAATTWTNTENIKVYCQDESGATVEYEGTFEDDGGWRKGSFTSVIPAIMGSFAAVSWHDGVAHIRLYMQDNSNRIIEWCYDEQGDWMRGELIAETSFPNCDIAAFTRTNHEGRWIHVYWANTDKLLHQRISGPGRGWMAATPLALLQSSGHWRGIATGKYFTDVDSGIDHKKIRAIHFQCDEFLNGLSIEYTDGSQTPWRGGTGGSRRSFILNDDEDITRVWLYSDKTRIKKMSFVTSKGRKSDWFGTRSSPSDVWGDLSNHINSVLSGFIGSAVNAISNNLENTVNHAQDVIAGLGPVWTNQPATTGLPTLDKMITEANKLKGQIDTSSDTITQQGQQLAQLSSDITSSLQAPATDAINTIIKLGNLVVQLNTASQADLDTIVGKCKTVSIDADNKFQKMHDTAKGLLTRATQLATDSTDQVATAQTRQKSVRNMQTVSNGTRANEETVLKLRQERVDQAQADITKAEATLSAAQEKKDDNENVRIVRDVFTCDLGEAGDWGDIDAAIDNANQLIANTKTNLQTCQTALTQAQADLNTIDNEIAQFNALDSNLSNLLATLNGQVDTANGVLAETQTLENNSLNIALFLDTLCGKSSVLFAQHTAHQLATSVLAIESVLKTGVKCTGAFFDDPDSLDKALNTIASSKVAPVPVDDSI